MTIKLYTITTFLFFLQFIFGQNQSLSNEGLQVPSEMYSPDIDGTYYFKVNLWGHIETPGVYTIVSDDDLATLFAVAGGPKEGANLKKIKLYRKIPDKNGKTSYTINLHQFIKSGDRSNFIALNPDDTVIIPQKKMSLLYGKIKLVDTFLSLLVLFFQVQLMLNN